MASTILIRLLTVDVVPLIKPARMKSFRIAPGFGPEPQTAFAAITSYEVSCLRSRQESGSVPTRVADHEAASTQKEQHREPKSSK